MPYTAPITGSNQPNTMFYTGGQTGYAPPGAYPQNRGAAVPANGQQPSAAPMGGKEASGRTPEPKNHFQISRKITNRFGTNKAIDFNDCLIQAHVSDYANIHGCGGSNHAPNSTIGVVICDSTRGTGNNSVTVKYHLNVRDIGMLYHAAIAARLGQLKPAENSQAIYSLKNIRAILDQWKQIPPNQDFSRTIPQKSLQELDAIVQQSLTPLSATTGPSFSYIREKNNPYAVANGYAPVSKITINYSPVMNGRESRYPWYIGIENFDAPIAKKANGASTHNSKAAINKRNTFINLSADDFASVMESITSYIRVWENAQTVPTVRNAIKIRETQLKEKQNDAQRI